MRKDFEENFLVIDGIRIRYFVCGAGKSLLFLHGGGLRAMTYRRNIELLAEKYTVIAPDIPGFGRSDTPDMPWNFDDFANLFSRFLDILDIQNCILVGHSFGGGIALHLASKNERISSLILIDSAGIPPDYSSRHFLFRLAQKTWRGFFLFKNKKITLMALSDFCSGVLSRLSSSQKIWKMTTFSIYGKTQVFEQITQPTHILWGDTDELFPRTHAEEFSRRIKNSATQYVEGNHDWVLLFPEKFLELMEGIG